jgi:hypothetical protein
LSFRGLKWAISGWQIASTLLPNSLAQKLFFSACERPLVSPALLAENDAK